MALGSMVKNNKPVEIICCGINYFSYSIRSEVMLDFSKPIKISDEDLQLYKTNKRKAVSDLLKKIEDTLNSVKITA